MAFDLFAQPDLSMYEGLLNPEQLAKMQQTARQREQQAFGMSLLRSAAPSPVRQNFAAGFGNALAEARGAGDSYLGQRLPLAMQIQALQAKKAQTAAEQEKQAQLQEALRAGNWAVAAAIDPSATNAFRQATAPKQVDGPMNVGPGGALVDPRTGKIIFQAPFRPDSPAPPAGFRPKPDGGLEPIPGGPADPAAPKAPAALSAEGSLKLSQLQNALTAAKQYREKVVGADGGFNDIASNLPEAKRILLNAVRAKLRAESGATITEDEVNAELARYGQQFSSSDATNASAVDRLISDLENQIGSLSPQSRSELITVGTPMIAPEGAAINLGIPGVTVRRVR